MNKTLKKISEPDTKEIAEKRKAWEELRELHNMYDKHELYKPKGAYYSSIVFCKTCGQVMMHKQEWGENGDVVTRYAPLNPDEVGKAGWDAWYTGTVSDEVVDAIPKQFRHFVYEQLFFQLSESRNLNNGGAALILSLRDPSVPLDSLRKHCLGVGGKMALAYADAYKDFSDDLAEAACVNAELAYRFHLISARPVTDDMRRVMSQAPEHAYKCALNLDKKPHPVTRGAAARHPGYAAKYAVEVDKDPNTTTSRGTPLRQIALRTERGAAIWEKAFGLQSDNSARIARSKTMSGAWDFARNVDKGVWHPVTQAGISGSSYYAPRYSYQIKGEPFDGAEEGACSGAFNAIMYAMTWNKTSDKLERACQSSRVPDVIYHHFKNLKKLKAAGKPMTKEAALKKSVTALAYVAVEGLWNDSELFGRLSSNRVYTWVYEACKDNQKDIRAARKRNKNKTAGK